jgi:hypothetical protein
MISFSLLTSKRTFKQNLCKISNMKKPAQKACGLGIILNVQKLDKLGAFFVTFYDVDLGPKFMVIGS